MPPSSDGDAALAFGWESALCNILVPLA